MVRAKFKVSSIRETDFGGREKQVEVFLIPVYGDGKENESWSKATPSGDLRMQITNPEALAQFSVGKEYFLDFTEAT